MRSIYFASTPGTYEDIYCSILQTWFIENVITAGRSLCWLVFLLGCVHYDVCNLEALVNNKKLLLEWNNDSNKGDVKNTDDDRPDEYTGPCKRRRTESAENNDPSGEQRTNDDEWQHEDEDNITDQQDSTGSGDDGDDDDNDDSDSDNEYSGDGDDDDEDYDEEDEESDDTESSEDDMDVNPLLAHAREVYASNSIRIFEREYRRSIGLYIDCTGESARGQVFKYVVHRLGDSSRKYKVTAQWFDSIVKCSCNYFSITGFLCCHSLKVLRCLQINKIPDRYLLRWQLRNFNCSQTRKPSSLETRKCPQSADDTTKVSRGKRRSLYITHLDNDVNSTDVDYIVAPLLRHAKDIYLPEIYNLFRKEYERSELMSSYTVHMDMNERGLIVVYNVHRQGRSGNFMVHSEPANGTVNCTCQQFASTGILCSHALLVLYATDIVRIPPQYIVARLLKATYVFERLHGPKYPEFESLHRWMVKKERIDKVLDLVSRCKVVGVDPGFIEGCLGQLSTEQCKKVAVGGDVFSYKYLKAQVKFWDDQCIRCFSYQKPVVIGRRFLLSTGLAVPALYEPHESPSLLSS